MQANDKGPAFLPRECVRGTAANTVKLVSAHHAELFSDGYNGKKEMSQMKILRRLIKAITGRLIHKTDGDEQIYCTETRCHVPKVAKGSIDQNIPARDRCFNISNCSL